MEAFDALGLDDKKRKYILEKLNPLLEHLVAETIAAQPEDPVPFMLDWMEEKRVAEEEKDLTENEKEELAAENAALQEEVKTVAEKLGEAAKMGASEEGPHDDDEEEEDDADDEPPPGFFDKAPPANKARTSVSAEAYGEWNTKKIFIPPVVSKSKEQKERLRKTLTTSFLFSNLESNDLEICIGAMKEVIAEPNERVINQGDSGDFLFIIEFGHLQCYIKLPDGTEKMVKTCEAGDVFGELALLYNCPRAASVIATERCTLWQLDRDTFNHIVKEAAQKRRNRYDKFLASVPFLSGMSAYERSQLADALKVETFEPAEIIFNQGDDGLKFYILEEGNAEASKNKKTVMTYEPGDYFGELALIRSQPRAATVVCMTAVKALTIDTKSFKRLLDVDALTARSAKYG